MDKYSNNYESKLVYVEEQMKDFQQVLLAGNIAATACLLSVLTQFIFNAFSFYNLPFDTWTLVDLANILNGVLLARNGSSSILLACPEPGYRLGITIRWITIGKHWNDAFLALL